MRLDFYWLILNWAFLLSFLTKWLLRNEMQKSNNDSVQTCTQEPETTAVPRLAHSKKFECTMIFKDDEWPGRKMTISEEIWNIKLSSITNGHIRYVPFS